MEAPPHKSGGAVSRFLKNGRLDTAFPVLYNRGTTMEVYAMKKYLYTALIVVLLLVFGVSAFFVGRYVLEGRQQAQRFDELAQKKEQAATVATQPQSTQPEQTPDATTDATQATTEPGEPTILPEYAELYEMNTDMVGWIKIEGTKVDYPVMQTPNETDYYLKRSFDKTYSERGSIYVREVCDVNAPSDNLTIYGHNMLDGSMFAVLHKYENKEFWEQNNLIFFDTLTERHTYKIFAVFKTSANLGEGFAYHKFVDAANEKEFDDFIATCKELSKKYYYDTGITPVYGDKIICLSTCEYTLGDNSRLVVAAVRYT